MAVRFPPPWLVFAATLMIILCVAYPPRPIHLGGDTVLRQALVAWAITLFYRVVSEPLMVSTPYSWWMIPCLIRALALLTYALPVGLAWRLLRVHRPTYLSAGLAISGVSYLVMLLLFPVGAPIVRH